MKIKQNSVMYERKCCETLKTNALTATTISTRRTRILAKKTLTTTKRIHNENSEHKCRCQRKFQRRTHHSGNTIIGATSTPSYCINNRESGIQSSVSMRPQTGNHHRHQHQHQQQLIHMQQESANNLISLQMTSESSQTSIFMENDVTTSHNNPNRTNTIGNGRCNSPASPASSSSTNSSLSSSESSGTTTTTNTTTTTTPSLGVNLRVTGQCSQGGRKYMEDYFSVAYQHSENAKDLEYAFFGIFDGHGGAEAATFAKEHLMMEIINQKLFWSDSDQDVLRAIREGYIATHFAMWREQDKWPKTANGLPSTAGTTATVAFIRHEKIYIGHVGDSGIVLGYQNDGEKWWRAKQLTIDHKPESMAERSRIMRSGGKVVVKSGVPRVVWNRPRNAGHRGPIRHNTPIDEIPFLAVARSLGDLWSYNSLCNEFVVSPDPDVRVVKINPKTFRCLIFGTDGLWNVVTPQEAVNTVFHNEMVNDRLQRQRGENLSNENGWMNPSKVLVDRALGTWSAKKMRADNTSVVTVILHPPNSNNGIIDNLSCPSKSESCMDDNYGIDYTQQTNAANHMNCHEAISYHEMAEKYLPPEEYRNFSYYEDNMESNGISEGNRSYYDERYAKLTNNGLPRYSLPNTLEALEFICTANRQHTANDQSNAHKMCKDLLLESNDIGNDDNNANKEYDGCEDDHNDDDDDEDDDDDDGIVINENENRRNSEDACSDMLVLNSFESQYMDQQKNMTKAFDVNNSSCVDGVDETTTSSYMSTFTESYNTLLGSENGVSDDHMSSDVSTSNSSNSYKSHSATCIQELVQEQQLYQQQCMSEEEGYSLTKLETRREQQRCNSSNGVQTFRIFQQQNHQQQHQPQQEDNNIQKMSNTHTEAICHQNYEWEPRFSSAFSNVGGQRLQNYQQHQQAQQQQQQFMLEQQLKSLELNSLLQQELEEEQQVEFERQMEFERFQQQQTLQPNHTHLELPSALEKSDFLLMDGNDNASSEVLTPITNNSSNSSESDNAEISIEEEYLLLDEEPETNDASVQINEISSSSSCLLESDVPVDETLPIVSKVSLNLTNSSSTQLFSPLPSTSSSSGETIYGDALEPTSDESLLKCMAKEQEQPKIIEKLEKIEILHEKPELVIETTPCSSIATRSKYKINMPTTTTATSTSTIVMPQKRRCRSNVAPRLHFPNIPNENQNQHQRQHQRQHQVKQTKSQTSLKNGILKLTPVNTSTETQSLFTKRQLRSTSSGSNNGVSNAIVEKVGDMRNRSNCSIAGGNRKTFYHTTNDSVNSSIDYDKRTLRARNSLTKDLKAKTNLLASSIKRSASAATTRFLRTQSANLLNIHQSTHVIGSNCKKTVSTTPQIISPAYGSRKITQQQHQQSQQQQKPQQRSFTTTTTFNFINLRSRQIGGNGNTSSNSIGNIAAYNKNNQREQAATTSSLQSSSVSVLARSPTKSTQFRNHATSNATSSTAINSTQNSFVRRNLRSLASMRPPCIKGKVTISTSTSGLTNYCKSMRSQSLTALVTPPPPSPKHFNPASTNVTIAVTRARTANTLPASCSSSSANSLLLNGTIGLHGNRKRTIRATETKEQDVVTPIFIATRAQKRLRR